MMKIGVVMGEVGKHGDKREKGGRRRNPYLRIFGEVLGEQSCKEGVLLEIVLFEGIQQLRACTRFGLEGPKGYLWSWVVGETSPVGRVARLVEFQNLGRTFGCREKQGKTTNKDSNKGGPTSYLQEFSSRYVIVSTFANSV